VFLERNLDAWLVEFADRLLDQRLEMVLVFVGQQGDSLIPVGHFQMNTQTAEGFKVVGSMANAASRLRRTGGRKSYSVRTMPRRGRASIKPERAHNFQLLTEFADADAGLFTQLIE
jgi:hypothetical protein